MADEGKTVVHCSKCGTRLRVRSSALGRAARCPRCGGVFRVQAETTGADEDMPAQGSAIRMRERDGEGVDRAGVAPLLAQALDTLPDYEIIEEIASGGMGIVFKARQRSLNRMVALKVMKPDVMIDEESRRRFRREAEAVAQLRHPGIVGVYDAGQVGGLDYYTMEYVEGRELGQYLREENLPTRERLRLFQSICEALDYAHQHGVIHRDLKPSNIMVTAEREPRVLDFGLARLRQQ